MKINVRRFINVFLLCLVMCIGCLLKNVETKAEETAIYNNQLETNGEWVNYYLNKGEYQYIPIITTKPGKLYITFRTFCGPNYVRILDSDLQEISCEMPRGSTASPEIVDFAFDLEAGTYYVRYEYWNEVGNYDVKATFKDANNNEIEPNNTYNESMNLDIDKSITGFLSYQDEVDFYKITVNKKQEYKIIYRSTDGNGLFTLFDSDLRKIEEKWIYYSDTNVFEKSLTQGIYYISFTRKNGTGTYTLKYNTSKVNCPNIKSLKKGKKSITVYLSEYSDLSGVKIQYSTKKKFTKKTTKTVKANGDFKLISKLKSKKKYYVRVRGYKIQDGKKVYSSWSKVKTVITK